MFKKEKIVVKCSGFDNLWESLMSNISYLLI